MNPFDISSKAPMGFLDKAKALTNVAVEAEKRAADVVVEHVEEASKKR